MRQIVEGQARDGTPTYRVRFRRGQQQTSETFRNPADARTFAAILDSGGSTEALAWLSARENKASTLTFGEWFPHYVEQLTGVTDRTRADYLSMHRRYLSHLDPTPLPLLTRTDITAIVNDLDRAGRSAKTIKQAIHLLSTALTLAVRSGHMTTNPCEGVRLPSAGINGVEPRFLTYEEAGLLLSVMQPHYQPLVTFLFGTGMRWSEATAIQARHVNIEAGTVRVEQAWKRVPGKGIALGPPKTAKSRRTVNAAVPALVAIEPLLRRPTDLVFTTKDGRTTVQHANFYNNVWRKACARAGFDPAPRIHDARHSHASWLISEGKSLEQVQDQLGHESILTTRSVYGHLQPALGVEVGRTASEAMQRVLAHQARAVRAIEAGGGAGG